MFGKFFTALAHTFTEWRHKIWVMSQPDYNVKGIVMTYAYRGKNGQDKLCSVQKYGSKHLTAELKHGLTENTRFFRTRQEAKELLDEFKKDHTLLIVPDQIKNDMNPKKVDNIPNKIHLIKMRKILGPTF